MNNFYDIIMMWLSCNYSIDSGDIIEQLYCILYVRCIHNHRTNRIESNNSNEKEWVGECFNEYVLIIAGKRRLLFTRFSWYSDISLFIALILFEWNDLYVSYICIDNLTIKPIGFTIKPITSFSMHESHRLFNIHIKDISCLQVKIPVEQVEVKLLLLLNYESGLLLTLLTVLLFQLMKSG